MVQINPPPTKSLKMVNGNNLLFLLKDPTFNFLKEIFEFLYDFLGLQRQSHGSSFGIAEWPSKSMFDVRNQVVLQSRSLLAQLR